MREAARSTALRWRVAGSPAASALPVAGRLLLAAVPLGFLALLCSGMDLAHSEWAQIMNLLGIGTVIESVGKIAGDLITTDKERLELELRAKELDQAIDLAQIEVNQTEAQHSSIFVAGWRPAIGWIGAAGMAYQFLLYPLMLWGWAYFQGTGWIPKELQPPRPLDADQLWVILSGILGIAGMRSFEKTKGVAR